MVDLVDGVHVREALAAGIAADRLTVRLNAKPIQRFNLENVHVLQLLLCAYSECVCGPTEALFTASVTL